MLSNNRGRKVDEIIVGVNGIVSPCIVLAAVLKTIRVVLMSITTTVFVVIIDGNKSIIQTRVLIIAPLSLLRPTRGLLRGLSAFGTLGLSGFVGITIGSLIHINATTITSVVVKEIWLARNISWQIREYTKYIE
jgi:hypothetical protein